MRTYQADPSISGSHGKHEEDREKCRYMKLYILIPAYKPEHSMIEFISELIKTTRRIVVVDDGGGAKYAEIFQTIKDLGLPVVHHEVNRGKGAALRTGIQYILRNYECDGIVTADCDGQHTVHDILRVSEELKKNPEKLIIGGRALVDNVPLRSRFGNSVMRNFYRLATGYKVHDTQTGLRGIPASLFERLLRLKGDRYEYEMNMLLYLRQWKVEPKEILIETIYINNNEGSHFDTVKDSSRIVGHILAYLCKRLFSFFKFALSSLVCYGFEYALFQIIFALFNAGVVTGNIVARICSAILNYSLNRKLVFKNKSKNSIIKYFGLVAVIMAISTTCIWGVTELLVGVGVGYNFAASVSKLVVDAVLFCVNYFVQREYVFKNKNTPTSEDAG